MEYQIKVSMIVLLCVTWHLYSVVSCLACCDSDSEWHAIISVTVILCYTFRLIIYSFLFPLFSLYYSWHTHFLSSTSVSSYLSPLHPISLPHPPPSLSSISLPHIDLASDWDPRSSDSSIGSRILTTSRLDKYTHTRTHTHSLLSLYEVIHSLINTWSSMYWYLYLYLH